MKQPRPSPVVTLRGQSVPIDRMWTMGVVNANPDSFSDGGGATAADLLRRCDELVAAGADVIDIGGQSAITNRDAVPAQLELDRVAPLVEYVRRQHPAVLVSVDTFKPLVAEGALGAGADIINDVSGLADASLAEACARHDAALILMHTSAAPLVRLQDPNLHVDVTADVVSFIRRRLDDAARHGLPAKSVIVDPGPDFTKTPAQTLEMLRGLESVRDLGRPVLLALSRKDFLGAITGRSPRERDAATHAAIAHFAASTGLIVRVHDVAGARDVIAVAEALAGLRDIPREYRLPDSIRHEPVVN